MNWTLKMRVEKALKKVLKEKEVIEHYISFHAFLLSQGVDTLEFLKEGDIEFYKDELKAINFKVEKFERLKMKKFFKEVAQAELIEMYEMKKEAEYLIYFYKENPEDKPGVLYA